MFIKSKKIEHVINPEYIVYACRDGKTVKLQLIQDHHTSYYCETEEEALRLLRAINDNLRHKGLNIEYKEGPDYISSAIRNK